MLHYDTLDDGEIMCCECDDGKGVMICSRRMTAMCSADGGYCELCFCKKILKHSFFRCDERGDTFEFSDNLEIEETECMFCDKKDFDICFKTDHENICVECCVYSQVLFNFLSMTYKFDINVSYVIDDIIFLFYSIIALHVQCADFY